jgi:hypothetical protein
MSLTTRQFGIRRGLGLSALAMGLAVGQWASYAAPQGVVVSGGPESESTTDIPDWAKKLAIDPESSAAKKYAQQQKVRVAAEKELKKIRATNFGQMRNESIRQEGILKLRKFDNPALFSSLIEIFGREQMDVRNALLDMFADSKAREGDTALTWVGVFDESPEVRASAIKRLKTRIKEEGEVPETTKLVCYEGIRSGRPAAMAAAAQLANNLDIIEAIPWLINGQVQGSPAGGGGPTYDEHKGDLAWIMVGTQTAFVSDLTPVVGPSAVAFDPQLSVITEGVLLRVLDAVVVSYNVDLNNSLTDMTSRLWGQSTRSLGWNIPAWRDWYAKEFQPFIAEKQAAEAAAKADAAAAPSK